MSTIRARGVELAAEHPNLVATKQGTGDVLRIHALLTGAPTD